MSVKVLPARMEAPVPVALVAAHPGLAALNAKLFIAITMQALI